MSAPEMPGTFSSCLYDVSKLEVIEGFLTFDENSDPDIVLGHSTTDGIDHTGIQIAL